MFYWLVQHNRAWLEEHNLGFLRVFTFVTFQSLIAVLIAFTMCLLLGPPFIAWLRKQKIGDRPEFDQAEINKMMEGKKGTPTMGGVLIVASISLAVLLVGNLENFYVLMALTCTVLLAGCGALDDWLKLTKDHRSGSRQGLSSREKFFFQVCLSLILAYFTYRYGRNVGAATKFYAPFFKDPIFHVNLWTYMIVSTLVMTGSSNAVNLTDGLDGLASGCMAIVSFTFLVLALIVGDPQLSRFLLMPHIEPAGQMAVLAAAMAGACLGFLWWNCNPANVFMGDTGSLAMGGLIGYIAIVIRHEIILFLVGGVFVVEALSVMIQVSYFKYTKRKYGEGRRIFLMSPLHHHFQKKNWKETQIVTRFWLVGAMLAALGLATVKLR